VIYQVLSIIRNDRSSFRFRDQITQYQRIKVFPKNHDRDEGGGGLYGTGPKRLWNQPVPSRRIAVTPAPFSIFPAEGAMGFDSNKT